MTCFSEPSESLPLFQSMSESMSMPRSDFNPLSHGYPFEDLMEITVMPGFGENQNVLHGPSDETGAIEEGTPGITQGESLNSSLDLAPRSGDQAGTLECGLEDSEHNVGFGVEESIIRQQTVNSVVNLSYDSISDPSPTTFPMSTKQITIRYFYPIDPVTSTQQQDPVYNDPRCPIVKPIHEWPPPELVEWRKGKRVRWKSVDDVSFFESIKPLTVDRRKKPVVYLPMKGSVDPSPYRAMSIPSLSPSPSEDEDEDSYFDRRVRRRRSKSTATSSVARSTERCCHQCRRSHTVPPAPKMICSSTKPNGEACVLRYCITCVKNRYEEPFEPSMITWTCFFCRGICNCSKCLRKEGFGYIFDGPLAEELKQRRRLPSLRKPKSNSSRTPDNRPSISTWLARRGVVTGTATWMAERRSKGIRFVIGRSPTPGIDSSVPVEESQFIQQYEQLGSRAIASGQSSDMTISAQVCPTELTGPSSGPVEVADWDTPQSTNPYDVFPALNFRGKRFFVGKRLNRHVRPAAIKNPSGPNTKHPDCQDVESLESHLVGRKDFNMGAQFEIEGTDFGNGTIPDPVACDFDSWLINDGLDESGNYESDDIDAIGEPDPDATIETCTMKENGGSDILETKTF